MKSPVRTSRRWALIGVGVSAAALVGGLALAGAVQPDAPIAAAGPAASPDAPGSPGQGEPPVQTPQPQGTPGAGGPPAQAAIPDPRALPPAPFDRPSEVEPGLTASVRKVEAIEGVASGIGEIGGPALAFTIVLTNTGSSAVTSPAVVVNCYDSGMDPCIPLARDPNAVELPRAIPPGKSVEGVYVFAVAPQARESVTLSVTYDSTSPTVVFVGSVPLG